MDKVVHSTGKDDWRTPEEVLALVRLVGPIVLDPCADRSPENFIADANFFGPPDGTDGLAEPWYIHGGLVFVNPPYSESDVWTKKVVEEAARGTEIILLVPARTDTKRWHTIIAPNFDAICFWRGRITFKGATSGAPFPNALVYFGQRRATFIRAFRRHGWIIKK